MSSSFVPPLSTRLAAELLGTAFLLMAVVGSGIMAERLSGGNVAVALLCNSIATGAALTVIISVLAPISGAHFNPAVSMVFCLRRELGTPDAAAYSLAQIAGAVAGVLAAHLMFDQELVQVSTKVRAGPGQWMAETIAAFGLVLVILLSLRERADAVALNVGLFITAAYWFTASTSFANPAVTIARMLTDTFTGIRPDDAAPFILCQLVGAALALAASRRLTAALR